MDIDERKIGTWPYVAIDPVTGTHAVTGEAVRQPSWSRLDMPATVDAFYDILERQWWERMGYESERDYNRDRFYDEYVEM